MVNHRGWGSYKPKRLTPVNAEREAHACCHEAAVQFGDVQSVKRLLYELLQSQIRLGMAKTGSVKASSSTGLTISTLKNQ